MSRREWMTSAAVVAGAAMAKSGGAQERMAAADFRKHQAARRAELWSLLGELPERKAPTATLKRTEVRDGFRLEYLDLDMNDREVVPALVLVPDKVKTPAPGMVYVHWHGGDYAAGKTELLNGTPVLEAYAPVFAEKGIVAIAIDSWCFGERMTYPVSSESRNAQGIAGSRGESDTFKEMLWKGRVLFGMMMFDEWQALNYLCARPEVDADRVGAMGISMGATKSWWLAALDERVKCCIDLCCLTDFEALIEDGGLSRHGIYYYVPSLLKRFQTHEINELIVPRARLSLNGRKDRLTPARGVERIRDHLVPLYGQYGRETDCHIELFDCGHEELPEMRALVLGWMDRHLVGSV